MNKWIIYLNERFPLQTHIPIIGMFTASAICYSILTVGSLTWDWSAYFVAFFLTLSLFFLLRISDEFKDYEDDKKYRTYLPVIRGLIQLKELRNVAIIILVIQCILIYNYSYFRIPYFLALSFLTLMHQEFFVANWLKKNMFFYVTSHMLIIPLIDFVASAAHWGSLGIKPSFLLIYFFLVSFFNGIVLEVGRKIKPIEFEEPGVTSYTSLLGQKRSIYLWLILLFITYCIAIFASLQIGSSYIVLFLQTFTFLGCMAPAIKYLKKPSKKSSKWIEYCSGIWTFIMYFSLGVLPYLLQL